MGFSEQSRKRAKDSLISNENTFKKKRTDMTVARFKENRNKSVTPHRYETRFGVDQTALMISRVPFCEMTKKNGWDRLILEEITARGINLSPDEQKNYTKVINSLKKHKGKNKSFKPVLHYERFVWYCVLTYLSPCIHHSYRFSSLLFLIFLLLFYSCDVDFHLKFFSVFIRNVKFM